MKNANFKLKKVFDEDAKPYAINILGVGLVYSFGEFMPHNEKRYLYISELKQIIAISENFSLFFENLND